MAEFMLSTLALVISMATLGVFLTLLGRGDFHYASRRDITKLGDHVTAELGRHQARMSQLYRYVEAVDEAAGGTSHRVLCGRLPADDTQGRD